MMKRTENNFTLSLQQSGALLCVFLSVTITNHVLKEAEAKKKKKMLLEVSQLKRKKEKNCRVFLPLSED